MSKWTSRWRRTVPVGVLLAVVASVPGTASAQQKLGVAARDSINPGLDTRPPQVSRRTPASSWRSFLSLARAGAYGAAAHLFDLTEVPRNQQRTVGAEIAEKLFKTVEKLGIAKAR